jgi:alpha-galactosidase
MNMDDCVVVGRNATTHELIPDPLAFPRGPAAYAAELAARGYAMGWYTCRGDSTCASRPPPLQPRPGSAGFEALDAALFARWGISYLKDDTCGPPRLLLALRARAGPGDGAHGPQRGQRLARRRGRRRPLAPDP